MLTAPFPFYGSKRYVVDEVWQRFGSPIQYIEPFCGSAAILLGAPKPASLEITNDGSGFIANFWRAVKYQPENVARWADYPISHVDLGARHLWLMEQREQLGENLQDPNSWPSLAGVTPIWRRSTQKKRGKNASLGCYGVACEEGTRGTITEQKCPTFRGG